MKFIVVWVLGFAVTSSCVNASADYRQYLDRFVPIYPLATLDKERFALGGQLFADTNLSQNGDVSCQTCHQLDKYMATNSKQVIGNAGMPLPRNSPTILNVSKNYVLGWRGNVESLEAQVDAVLTKPKVMGAGWNNIVSYLKDDEGYKKSFKMVYGGEVSKETIIDAIVYYEKSMVAPSRFDDFLLGDHDALSGDEKKGFVLFNQLGCSACHNGVNLGGNMLQPFGVFKVDAKVESNRYRVAPLRNVAETAPYFHDGRQESLKGAIRLMSEFQLGRELDSTQVGFIEVFLKTLTSKPLSWFDQ